ncbi:MAG: helix-turn-helix domain-containing protein [Bacteroidota bacterium]
MASKDLFELHRANPHIFPQFTVKDALFLHYLCPQNVDFVKLYAKHIQFAFTISGQRIVRHGNQVWAYNQTKGALLKKCAFLQELPKDYTDWNALTFYLKDAYLRSIFEEFRPHLSLADLPEPNPQMVETLEIDDQIRSCYESLIPYFDKEKQLPESILEGKFKELLFNIFDHPGNKHILAYILKITSREQTPIWEVMEENYMYDLKVSDFANLAGRSLAAFKRDFKNYYKTSPGRWLTERRLKRAKFQLETSDKTIKEVAFDCGFANASHFSRVFKEQFQESPSRIHA